MSTPPARCCAPATSGRCNNAPAPYGQSRYIGAVEIAACNHPKHQAALRSLPDFQRRAGVCGADDCGKAAESGLCPEHRQLYRRHGINIRALLAQEAPMTEPTITPAPADDGEPSEGDVADAPLFVGGTDTAPELVARWGQRHTAPLDGLAAIAARGQQPTAPGSTVAELHAVCLLMQQLGSYGPDASAMLMRLLPVESRRALLEIEASDARGELARARANVVNPPPPERVAELTAKVATLDARIAALDAG